jgi:hypothetical protein
VINSFCDWLKSDFKSHNTTWRNAFPKNYNLRNMFHLSAVYTYVHSSLSSWKRLRHVILNCIVLWAITWLNSVRRTTDRSFSFYSFYFATSMKDAVWLNFKNRASYI